MRRNGTVLIFAIAVTTLLLTVVFGFVRVAELQRNAGSATTPMLLSRQAALAGSQHALEAILREHADPSEPATRLDGPAMAGFRAIQFPWLRDKNKIDPKLSDPRLIGINDSTTEDLIPNCGIATSWSFDRGGYAYGSIDPLDPALSNWDGRGRWYELEMANPAVAATPAIPAGGEATTGAVRFSDADGELMDSRNGNANDAATLSAPTRCAPIMYDRQWRRLDYSTPAGAVALRSEARYRVRYAVGVRDLEGVLLLNPDPAFDPASLPGDPDPANASDPDVARMLRAWHAFPNTVNLMTHSTSQVVGRITAGVRAAHVLVGRGSAANYDRRSDADPWPRTFPLMYRGKYTANRHWLFNAADPQQIGVSLPRLTGPATNRGPWTGLFANSSGGATGVISGGRAPGGEQLADSGTGVWRNVLTGPQLSPFNAFVSILGGDNLQDGSDDGWIEESMLGMTPFGRGVRKSGAGDPVADTPWSVNPLTAPHNVLQGMVLATLPAGVLQVHYELKPLTDPSGGSNHRTTGSNSAEYWATVRTRNLWVKSQSTAFSRYEPPARHTSDDPTLAAVLKPDYHVLSDLPGNAPANLSGAEQGFIHPTQRYPGPVAWNIATTNGNTGRTIAWHDDLGRGIDVSEKPLIRDVWFRKGTFGEDEDKYAIAATQNRGCGTSQAMIDPFLTEVPSDSGWSNKDTGLDNHPAGAEYAASDCMWDRLAQDYTNMAIQVHPDSFYRDILYAFSNAVAMARMANCRLPVGDYTPVAGDLAHSGALATRPTTAAQLDALFLRCLGIDITNPAGGTVAGYCGDSANKPVSSTASANLATLAGDASFTRNVVLVIGETATTVDARMLTQVMERMLNDFRLSLLGSQPSYIGTFRPLDFNGDGKVACSGYPANPAYTASTVEWKCHVEQEATVGTAVSVPFSVAGNLKFGRSRFWEVWVRGEVFDNLAKRTVSQATLQTVYVVDPESASAASRGQGTHAVFQRWHYNMTKGMATASY